MSVIKASGSQSSARKNAVPQVARINTKRYFWLVVGYYLCTLYIRSLHVKADSLSSPDFTTTATHFGKKPIEPIPDTHEILPHQAESETVHHGIQIVKVDFEDVETPFIIALWIFCASLAKIGK